MKSIKSVLIAGLLLNLVSCVNDQLTGDLNSSLKNNYEGNGTTGDTGSRMPANGEYGVRRENGMEIHTHKELAEIKFEILESNGVISKLSFHVKSLLEGEQLDLENLQIWLYGFELRFDYERGSELGYGQTETLNVDLSFLSQVEAGGVLEGEIQYLYDDRFSNRFEGAFTLRIEKEGADSGNLVPHQFFGDVTSTIDNIISFESEEQPELEKEVGKIYAVKTGYEEVWNYTIRREGIGNDLKVEDCKDALIGTMYESAKPVLIQHPALNDGIAQFACRFSFNSKEIEKETGVSSINSPIKGDSVIRDLVSECPAPFKKIVLNGDVDDMTALLDYQETKFEYNDGYMKSKKSLNIDLGTSYGQVYNSTHCEGKRGLLFNKCSNYGTFYAQPKAIYCI